jgi:hypothetical protein
MLNAVTRILIFALLLVLSTGQMVHAENKLYQYDGKLPFVEMMLNMMSTMGIIDRVPNSMVNRGYGGYGSGFPNSGMSNPYMRALAMRGVSPTSFSSLTNSYSSNPFSRSPWLQSPLSQTEFSQDGLNPFSPVWGSPDWGVLPVESYSLNNPARGRQYPYAVQDGRYYIDPYWSRDDIKGWVNEPWENSSWNPDAGPSLPPQEQPTQAAPPALVQNFNYSVPTGPENSPPAAVNRQNNTAYNTSPLAKLAPRRRPVRSSQPVRPNSVRPGSARPRPVRQGSVRPESIRSGPARKPSPLSKRSQQNRPVQNGPAQNRQVQDGPEWGLQNKAGNSIYQKPCVTEFCGLKKPDMDGLWVAENGEMLGIKNNRYLWSDSKSRYLTGQLKIQNEYLLANVEGHDKLMRFKYKLAGNHLLTMQDDGTVREFVRMSRSQYQRLTTGGNNPSYGQNYRGYN